MQNKVGIFGCGGHARSVADVVLSNQPKAKIIFVDSAAKEGEKILGFPVQKMLKEKTSLNYCAIGDNLTRKKCFEKYSFSTLISKDSYLGQACQIGKGTFVAHHAHIGPCARIGKGCIINTASVIEHEVEVGDFSHISVNATLCGRVKIGSNVFVGAGSVIRDKVHICDNVIIGCGSVVVKDITESGVYVGCPAKKLGELK